MTAARLLAVEVAGYARLMGEEGAGMARGVRERRETVRAPRRRSANQSRSAIALVGRN